MSNTATVVTNKIAVRPSNRDGELWLTIDLPEGWDTLRPLTGKVLEFEGNDYTFRGWNSDRNEAFFKASQPTAVIR